MALQSLLTYVAKVTLIIVSCVCIECLFDNVIICGDMKQQSGHSLSEKGAGNAESEEKCMT